MSAVSPIAVFGLPVSNGEDHLAEALESLLGQTRDDLAVIVVDDCSTDRTGEIALRYAALDTRVAYERNERRLGLVHNWRRSFELAGARFPRAGYFAWASDHDVWDPSWVERLVGELEAHPETMLAYPHCAAISDTGERLPWPQKEFESSRIDDRRARVTAVIHQAFAGWAVYGLFRREALYRCGVFRPVILPDRLLVAEISLYGSIRQIDETLWFRRFREGVDSSIARQRRGLFTQGPPWYAYLPWWAPHGAVLFWTLVVRKNGRPDIGRREGAIISALYTAHAWSHATRDQGLVRWWRSRPRRWLWHARKRSRKRVRKLRRHRIAALRAAALRLSPPGIARRLQRRPRAR